MPSGTARRGTICHLSPHFAAVPRLRFQRGAGLRTASVAKHVACAGNSSSESTLRRGEERGEAEGGKGLSLNILAGAAAINLGISFRTER